MAPPLRMRVSMRPGTLKWGTICKYCESTKVKLQNVNDLTFVHEPFRRRLTIAKVDFLAPTIRLLLPTATGVDACNFQQCLIVKYNCQKKYEKQQRKNEQTVGHETHVGSTQYPKQSSANNERNRLAYCVTVCTAIQIKQHYGSHNNGIQLRRRAYVHVVILM